MKAHALATALLALLIAGRAAAEEWTRFRGPDGSGISQAKSVPVKWTEQDFTWKTKLPGSGHSSPVTWGGKVFVTCCDPKTAERTVVCVKAADGSVAWTQKFASTRHSLNSANSYASTTPAVDADRLYLYWTTPERITVLALDHDGKEAWRRDLGAFGCEHGGGLSPMTLDGLVIVPNDQDGKSSLLALDCTTGKTRWQIPRKSAKAAYSTPIVFRPEDGPPELIFTSMADGVTSVAPRTGEVNWQLAKAFPLRTVSSPAAAAGLVVGSCQGGGRGRRFVAVRPGSKAKGTKATLAYEIKKPIPAIPTPLGKDGLLFVWADRGEVACIRADTGKPVWEQRIRDIFYGSPVWACGRLYCMSRKGLCYVIAAGETYELLATNPLGETTQATPAIAHDTLYLRTLTHLIAIKGAE